MPPKSRKPPAPAKRKQPDTAEPAPTPPKAKKPKTTHDDSEEFELSTEDRAAQMVLDGRNRFEACDKHAHAPWNRDIDTLQLEGCFKKCEICGQDLPRNLMRHIKINHSYDPSGVAKNVPNAPDGVSVIWDFNKILGPKKGGQKTFVLDDENFELQVRAAQITKAGTAEGMHKLNKTAMAAINLTTRKWSENPVTGKPGSFYVKEQNERKRQAAAIVAARKKTLAQKKFDATIDGDEVEEEES